MDQGAVRNLEQIQEHDEQTRMPRWAAVGMLVLGGACVAFATLALSGRRSAPVTAPADPLGELVAQHGRAAQAGGTPAVKPTDLSTRDVTFPAILSDDTSPTTALAAVRAAAVSPVATTAATAAVQPTAEPNAAAPTAPPPTPPTTAPTTTAVPPPAADRLSVVPLPAQNVLEATPVITRPRDAMTKAATESAQITAAPPAQSGPGHDGGYQLQVSSFRTQAEANQFSDQLRARGHKAYVQEAHVTGRGTWFRVRVGPFPTQHAAASYRIGFESREHVVPFIVPPQVRDHDAPKP
jgi:septal ring-binding cell division protein DamX